MIIKLLLAAEVDLDAAVHVSSSLNEAVEAKYSAPCIYVRLYVHR